MPVDFPILLWWMSEPSSAEGLAVAASLQSYLGLFGDVFRAFSRLCPSVLQAH